jgi:hypothetical protein
MTGGYEGRQEELKFLVELRGGGGHPLAVGLMLGDGPSVVREEIGGGKELVGELLDVHQFARVDVNLAGEQRRYGVTAPEQNDPRVRALRVVRDAVLEHAIAPV